MKPKTACTCPTPMPMSNGAKAGWQIKVCLICDLPVPVQQ